MEQQALIIHSTRGADGLNELAQALANPHGLIEREGKLLSLNGSKRADRVGVEPTVPMKVRSISSRVP